MSKGVELWKKAKKIIPGANSLLSKRAEMFLPDFWPSYYEKAKGIKIWDLDGKVYKDLSIMGIGANILGYAHKEVDAAVKTAITKSVSSSLNCPEEVRLAERLLALHPWAEMVRYSRAGGEACAMAIRIARAASGRDVVAFCGYHGWHDWYLASNIADDGNLDGMLLPGLQPKGVPRGLKSSSIPFNYNKLDELEKIIASHDVGVIMMEPMRSHAPENNFLQKVRELATKKNIVLVFDEVSSGFRKNIGGIHLTLGVNPDLAVVGKALGNGYAISAVIGRRPVMEAAQSTFMSSTFWTERIGPTAALAVLDVMQRDQIYGPMLENDAYLRTKWVELATRHQLELHVHGLPCVPHFGFGIPKEGYVIKTLITQEMLKKGYLAFTGVYMCQQHTRKVIDSYLDALDGVFAKIKKGLENDSLSSMLDGPVCHGGFHRLA